MKRLTLKPDAIARARELRRDATPAERALWRGLRGAFPDARFRRQVPLGHYFADFASHAHRLVIEIDGSQHASAADYDAARDRFLNAEGYHVLRFWNRDVLDNLDGVLSRIAGQLAPTPRPPHMGEGANGQPPVGVR